MTETMCVITDCIIILVGVICQRKFDLLPVNAGGFAPVWLYDKIAGFVILPAHHRPGVSGSRCDGKDRELWDPSIGHNTCRFSLPIVLVFFCSSSPESVCPVLDWLLPKFASFHAVQLFSCCSSVFWNDNNPSF